MKHLVILYDLLRIRLSCILMTSVSGASYCDIGYDYTSPHPTRERPLGVEFPGTTYAEPGEPNWVGYLITQYNPNPGLLVYNFAKGGSRVSNVKNQIERQYLEYLAKKPDWAPWNADDTLFSPFLAFEALVDLPK